MVEPSEPEWQTLAREVVHESRVRLVDHTVLLADGSRSNYEVDESIPFAVATLVVDENDLILTRQYRYPIGRWIYDLPGGAGVDGESPEAAARRELEEELGLIPDQLVPLSTFFMNPGRAAWPVHIFLCEAGTTTGIADRSDPAEQVERARMTLSELDGRIADGDIVDPALIVARASAAARGYLPPLIGRGAP